MAAHTLHSLRMRLRCEAEALAASVDLPLTQYELLEVDNVEAEESLDLQQWTQLAAALGQSLLDVICHLGLASEPATGATIAPLAFRELRDRVGEEAARSGGVEALEARVGWDLRDFIRDPEEAWTRKLGFFRCLCTAVGCDWRGILTCYG